MGTSEERELRSRVTAAMRERDQMAETLADREYDLSEAMRRLELREADLLLARAEAENQREHADRAMAGWLKACVTIGELEERLGTPDPRRVAAAQAAIEALLDEGGPLV